MTMHNEELPTVVFHTYTFLHSFPLMMTSSFTISLENIGCDLVIDVLTHQCLAASGSPLQVTDL
jgi:hypothetical protein